MGKIETTIEQQDICKLNHQDFVTLEECIQSHEKITNKHYTVGMWLIGILITITIASITIGATTISKANEKQDIKIEQINNQVFINTSRITRLEEQYQSIDKKLDKIIKYSVADGE